MSAPGFPAARWLAAFLAFAGPPDLLTRVARRSKPLRLRHTKTARLSGLFGLAVAGAVDATLDDGSTVLGTVELKNGTLVLEANSCERAKLGQALIEPVLTDLIGSPVVESKTMAEIVASRPADRAEKPSSGLPCDEERDILRAFLKEYYGNLLDEPVPMLGNISPRRAAKTPQGRSKLVEWLKFLENGAAKNMSAGGDYDLRWMWEELGVAALRC